MEHRVTLMSEINEEAGRLVEVRGHNKARMVHSAHRVLLENILLQEADNQMLAF